MQSIGRQRPWTLLFASLAILSIWSLRALAEGSAATVFKSAAPSVVTIQANDASGKPASQGSGVVISTSVVVTNCHVTARARSILVGHNGVWHEARVRHIDRERDLCTLVVPALPAPGVMIGSSSDLFVGQSVYAIGSPQGLELSLSSGVLSSLRAVDGGVLIQTTAAISPGSSGGGLFDEAGRLIGITTLYLKEGQHLNFAVPVDWVSEIPSRHRPEPLVEDEIADAKEALNSLEADLRAEDAETYEAIKPQLVAALKEVVASKGPEEWVPEAREIYARLASAHKAAQSEHQEAVQRAQQDLNELGKRLQRQDPKLYEALAPRLFEEVSRIAKSAAPGEWVGLAEKAFAQLAASHRQNERWLTLGAAGDRVVRIDKSTIETRGDEVTFWIQTQYAQPTLVHGISGVAKSLVRQKIDCRSRTVVVLELIYYSISGGVLLSDNTEGIEGKIRVGIAPGSVAENVQTLLCQS